MKPDLRIVLFSVLALIAALTTYFAELDSADAALLFVTIAFLGLASMLSRSSSTRTITAHDIEMQLRYFVLDLPKDDRPHVTKRIESGDLIGAAQALCAALERNDRHLTESQLDRLETLVTSLGISGEWIEPLRKAGDEDGE